MEQTIQKKERILSIDALRGFDMFLICGGTPLIVNFFKSFDSPITKVAQAHSQHAKWEGLTFHDLIMPLFLFVVGVSMVFSFSKRAGEKKKLYTHVIYRFVILFILGMVFQGRLLDLKWDNLYFYNNTLQAIAVGYLGAAFLLALSIRNQALITGALLISYWAALKFISVPSIGAGVYTPEGNLAAYIDTILLGSHRHGIEYTWILSSLVFIATTMLGVFCGHILSSGNNNNKKRAICLVGFGLLCLGLGYALSYDQPIIKKIWTSSFTLVSGGYCVLLLTLFYWVIDVLQFRRWSFIFVVIGSNAIFAYMVFSYNRFIDAGQIANKFLYGVYQWTGDWTPFVRSFGAFAVTWLILYWMYKKKCFIKI